MIFAPNAGVSLSTGGGTKFVMLLADILSTEFQYDVILAGFHSFSLKELDHIHGTSLSGKGNAVKITFSKGSDGVFKWFRSVPFKLSPYNLLLANAFSKWVRQTIIEYDPDQIWFNDDIPKAAEGLFGRRKVILYVHYPFAGRIGKTSPPMHFERDRVEKVNETVLQLLRGRLIVHNPQKYTDCILVNSTVSARAVSSVWPGAHPTLVSPFYCEAVRHSHKTKTMIAIGSIQREKRYEDLISAVSQARSDLEGWTVYIVGFERDRAYRRKLMRIISEDQLEGITRIIVNASRDLINQVIEECKFILQLGVMEPFGIALLEGMSYGAIPLVRRSEFSGAWIDILDRGRFGCGFKGPKDLSALFRTLIRDPELCIRYSEIAFQRACHFSRCELTNQLKPVLE